MQLREGYEIKDGLAGRFLTVTGPWTKGAERALERVGADLDGLVLNYARGFREPDLGFLCGWPVKRLMILARWLVDLEPVYRMAGTLEAVSLAVDARAVLDCGRLPLLTELGVEGWRPVRASIADATKLRRVDILNYQGADLQPLAANTELRRIQLRGARSMRTLTGVESLTCLEELFVALAPRVVDVSPLQLRAQTCGYLISRVFGASQRWSNSRTSPC